MLDTKIAYVVGDKFKDFTQLDNVLSYSSLIKIAEEETGSKLKNIIYILGQGLNKNEKETLEVLSRKNKIGPILNSLQIAAPSDLTHKHQQKNTMITVPLMVQPHKLYRAYLTIDDNCAEMDDHTTGKHIQGMVLTEAARQMMLAVAEKYILQGEEKGNSYCALNSISSTFLYFAFPVNIHLEHEITANNKIEGKGYEVKTRTRFIQNNRVICYVDIDYKFFKKDLLKAIEDKIAAKTIQSLAETQMETFFIDMAA